MYLRDYDSFSVRQGSPHKMTLKLLRNLDDQALKALLEFVPFPMALIDKSQFLFINKPGKDLLGKTQYNFSIPDIYQMFRNEVEPIKKEVVLLTPMMEKHWVEVIGEPVWYQNTLCVLGYITDISKSSRTDITAERVTNLQKLMLEINTALVDMEDTQHTFHLILTNALKAIKNASMGSIMILKNGYFEAISYIGYGKDIETFKLPLTDAFLYRSTEGKMDHIINIPNLAHDDQFHPITTYMGNEVYISSHIAAPIFVKEQFYGMICLDSLQENAFEEEDVASMEFLRSNVQIVISNQLLFIEKSHQAMFDQLTGLYNRHYFNEHFEMIKNKAIRYDEKFYFVLFDIDELKSVNDRYGHSVGDQTIVKITQQLSSNTRKSDVIARFGGDEFVGIYYASTPENLNEKFSQIRRELIQEPIISGDANAIASFSYGIVEFPTDGTTLEMLLKAADVRMYANKKHKSTK